MQDRPPPLDPFVGRTAELARMAAVVCRAESGQPWLVAIEGDPGVGKTSLVRRSLAGISGLRVLSVRAVTDMTASMKMAREGATLSLGLRACCYLALAQYLTGAWNDVLLTAEQGFSAAAIHSRRYELPLLHLAAGCVPAGRGAAEEAAASLDYPQENVYAAMVRALVCQTSGDYLGVTDALGRRDGWLSRVVPRSRPGGSTSAARTPQARTAGSHRPPAAVPWAAPATDGPAAPGGRAAAAGERLVPDAARRAVHRPYPEIAAELFISRKAVEYHLGNIYAKCGLQGRQELRRFVGQWRHEDHGQGEDRAEGGLQEQDRDGGAALSWGGKLGNLSRDRSPGPGDSGSIRTGHQAEEGRHPMSTPVLSREAAQPAPVLAPWLSARSGQLLASRAQALFASDLSARREHTRTEVTAAIRQAISAHHGLAGCAGQVAAAYGEHPETAAGRMRWARAVIQALQAPAGSPGAAT